MYIGALIQLPDGSFKIANGVLGIMKYAKAKNKLVKVICDNPLTLGTLRKTLLKDHPNAIVEYGVKGELELELETNET